MTVRVFTIYKKMILDEYVVIKGSNRNITYYKSKGYDIKNGEDVKILISDLNIWSKNIINVRCDKCSTDSTTSFKTYLKSTDNLTTDFYCGDCKKFKAKETVIKRYNVSNVFQLESSKQKAKESNIRNNGVEYPLSSKTFRDKGVETWKKKYNTTHPLLNVEYKENHIKKNREIFGKDYAINQDFSKDNQKLYFKNKVIDNYKILLDKYSEYELIDYIENKLHILHFHSKCNKIFEINRSILYDRINDKSGELCILCNPVKSNISSYELDICKYLDSLNVQYITNNRTILNGKELDIYLPDYNLAIEFNGLYWHSELFKDKYYHYNKTVECSSKNIDLIHIFEDDWKFKNDIVKSIINNRLNKIDNKIYARKCDIRVVKPKESEIFLNMHHIQGNAKSSYKIGLYYNNELISLMIFGERKTNSKKEFELIRFCNKINTNVVGSASKLFNYFLKTYNIESKYILSYADLSMFSGNLYDILGFDKIHTTEPNYFWVVDDVRCHRWKYNKAKLIKEGFDKDKSEVEIMHSRGYYRVFGCGQVRYEYNIN